MPKIAVWFSCGAASAVAAKMTFLRYGATHEIRVLNTPIVEEGEDNRRFLRDVERWLECEIESVVNPNFPSSAVAIWDQRKAMSFPRGAPCTVHAKKEARQLWEETNPVDWHVFGFTRDEKARHDRFVLTERDNVLPVLIDEGLTKEDCFNIITAAGIQLPEAYLLGYPNANCRGCVKATSPTYWNHVRKVDPEVFASRAAQSRRLGSRLVRVNNRRIFLDELDPAAKGRPMQNLKLPDCGIICEEPPPRRV